MTINDKIRGKLADKMNLRHPQIAEAIQSQFDYLVMHMESGDLTPIRMQYLGLWICKPTRIAKLKEKGLL